jgi:MFS family permease
VPRRLFLDIGPLRRSRDFRYLYLGEAVSIIGSQLTVVGVPYQIYRITHSSLDVGLASLGQLLPLIVCSLFGGALADAHDRRKILLVTDLALALCSGALALNALHGQGALWPLYVFTALAAGLAGVEQPTRTAAGAAVVAPEDLVHMSALWQVLFQVGVVVGPSVAGLLLAGVGLAPVYWIDMGSFLAVLVSVWLMRPLPPAHRGVKVGFRSVGEGLRFVRAEQPLQGIYLIDLAAMIFGMPRALFPALGTGFFHGGARAVGYLYAAPGVGALIGALTTGWVGLIRRQGYAVVLAVLVWGASIAVFGLVPWLPLALVLLAIAGWADVLSAVFRNTILQTTVPDRLRGRLNAVQTAVVTGGPRLGDFEAGGVATAISDRFSVVSGGLGCIALALVVAGLLPIFRNYEYRRPPGD